MTREELDFIGGMNMCDEISNEAYRKICCHCEVNEPKRGHWNTYKLSQGGIDEEWLECSECMWSNALSIPRNYCPRCGVRMEVENDTKRI